MSADRLNDYNVRGTVGINPDRVVIALMASDLPWGPHTTRATLGFTGVTLYISPAGIKLEGPLRVYEDGGVPPENPARHVFEGCRAVVANIPERYVVLVLPDGRYAEVSNSADLNSVEVRLSKQPIDARSA